MAGRVFISYRRDDTAAPAGWLSDRLAGHFGRHQVFKDVDSIPLGDDAAQVIAAAVASCDALLVLIGRPWLTASGPDGNRRLADPHDFVRLEIESALARDILVIPVLVDEARMPQPGELPPSLAALAGRPPLELSQDHLEADTARLLQVLGQSLAQAQATQASPVPGQPTVTGYRSPGPPPGSPWSPQAGPAPGSPQAGQPPVGTPTREGPPRPLRPRRRTLIVALVACAAVAAGIVAFIAVPGSHPKPPAKAASHRASQAKPAPSASPAASTVILADDFATQRINWTDDAHQAAGGYAGTGAYRLSVTGANGQAELARPASAAHGLSDVTPLNLSVSVDARKLAGAPQGYGYGLAFRADGSGDLYAFVIMDHAVAIQKWVGHGADVQGSPAPASTSALHAGAADRLRAVAVTGDGGKSVHLELWLNGKKLVDFTDRDHPYTKGYLGLYVESISDATSTAGAEFDNFSAARL
jgi:hypothetical protein